MGLSSPDSVLDSLFNSAIPPAREPLMPPSSLDVSVQYEHRIPQGPFMEDGRFYVNRPEEVPIRIKNEQMSDGTVRTTRTVGLVIIRPTGIETRGPVIVGPTDVYRTIYSDRKDFP